MYRTICTELWTDPKVRQLSVSGKLLFLYLITNPHTHLSGIYYLPCGVMTEETGLSQTACHTQLDTLSTLGNVFFDPVTSTIFVTNMFLYQGKGEKNERAAANHLRTLHDSTLICKFLSRYPSVRAFVSDTLSHRCSELEKRCPSVPVPDSDPVPASDSESGGAKGAKKLRLVRNGKTAFPSEWKLSEADLAAWQPFGLNVPVEFATFRDHAKANDRRCHDWTAAFRNWCRKAIAMKEGK